MNHVLKENRENGGYFIISVVKDDDKFLVRSKRVDAHGNVLVWNDVSGDGYASARFDTLKEAKERAKTVALTKRKKQGMIFYPEKDLPDVVKAKLAAPIDTQVTPKELIALVEKSRRERYVTFKNNLGIDNLFDLEVDYVGFIIGDVVDDNATMEVFDKFGQSQVVMMDRLATMVKTEQCLEAEGMKI